MKILAIKIKLYAPWVHSLKEKRMIVKSILGKLKNKFNVSVSEIEAQDIHQTIVIGVATIVPHQAEADSMTEEILNFVEMNTEAEILDAIHRPLGAKSVDAIKRRVRAGMGRCQGGFCGPKVIEILARELKVSPTEIRKNNAGSNMVTGKTR